MNEQFRLSDLQTKDVVNVRDGKNFGRICDMEMDAQTGNILRLVLPGRPRFFGLFGRDEDRDILWDQIKLIGIDAINLVESGLYRLCRRTVAVLAPTETRVRRIMARDGISEDYARLRVQAQKPDDFYRTHCTDVLMNDAATPDAFETIAHQRLQRIFEEETNHE